jgi:hypothetical protein
MFGQSKDRETNARFLNWLSPFFPLALRDDESKIEQKQNR